jgi:multidrug efflux system membrane fusion protein
VARALSARKAQQQVVEQAAATRAQAAVELAEGDVVKAQLRDIAQGLPISGSLKAFNTAAVKARVAGELQGLTLREGDVVKAGQVVARVDPTELQSRVRQAQEQADSARSQIDIAQRQWDNNKALVDQGFISRTALDTSANNLAPRRPTTRPRWPPWTWPASRWTTPCCARPSPAWCRCARPSRVSAWAWTPG